MPVGDIQFVDQQRAAQLAKVNQHKEEAVIYYRKPTHDRRGFPAKQAGWITWADTQDLKLGMILGTKRLEPLRRYGRIEDSWDPWAPILSHPSGPAEFPIDQIITFRWYDPVHLADQWKSMPPGTNPLKLFPQLRKYLQEGGIIEELECPACHDRTFLSPMPLAHHLMIHHDYTQTEVIAWGEYAGIDFRREMAAGKRKVIDASVIPDPEPEAEEEEMLVVTRRSGPDVRAGGLVTAVRISEGMPVEAEVLRPGAKKPKRVPVRENGKIVRWEAVDDEPETEDV